MHPTHSSLRIPYVLAGIWLCLYSITGCQSSGEGLHSLVAHFPLKQNFENSLNTELEAITYGNVVANGSFTHFDGKSDWLEVPFSEGFEGDEISISVWVNATDEGKDVPGDILSWYDSENRKGFHLSLKTNYVTTSQANYRQLTFGIDDNYQSEWEDVGKPGNALLAFSLADFEGNLYAGTCEPGGEEAGRVYRYDGAQRWIDSGNPDNSNSVMAMAEFQNDLYVGTGHYQLGGSSLPDSENQNPGGRIFRYEGTDQWVFCGQLPGVTTIGGMVVYKGHLYASSLYSPGFFRYNGGEEWIDCGTPSGKRVVALCVFNDFLYATSYDNGNVYRYDGESWEDCGPVGDNTQTYSFIPYKGELHVATWPSGRVYRFKGVNQWEDIGRLGEELEVMGMIVQNGRFIGGTLPLAEIYSYEGDTTWVRMEQLDKTPDVRYRRVWAMAEHDGKVFSSTLPSGHIFAFESGKSTSWGHAFPSGWNHVVATVTKNNLSLHVNGEEVSRTDLPEDFHFSLPSNSPLRIGFGSNDYFNGELRDLRIYNRSLSLAEIKKLNHE